VPRFLVLRFTVCLFKEFTNFLKLNKFKAPPTLGPRLQSTPTTIVDSGSIQIGVGKAEKQKGN
jgi:hypothetical protein